VVEKLADDALVVVASPRLLAQKKLMGLEDLERHVLLHDDEPNGWARWLSAHRARHLAASAKVEFIDSSMLVVAAVEGQGVALARRSLVLDDLAAERLVLPFPKLRPLPTGRSYYVAAPRERLVRPEVTAFRDWLRAEAKVLR
jgi:LysR family glycine cleavage system transcriptional activator